MEKTDNGVLRSALLSVKPHFLCVLALTVVLRALAVIVFANSVTQLIVATIAAERNRIVVNLALAWAAAFLKGASGWAGGVVSARVAIFEKERYREQLLRAVINYGFYDPQNVEKQENKGHGDKRPVSAAYMSTFGVEELSKFYTQLLPAILNAVIMPTFVGITLLFHDIVSALIVACTLPLVPLFMILIGLHTQERVSETQKALVALADHLSELVQGLPVIIGLGRAREQARALDNLSNHYRTLSVQALRVAFLSSLALELISTLSVAMVAVVNGVRLVEGRMDLELGLFVILLVPECYAPLQDVGAAFHASDVAKNVLFRIQRLVGFHGHGEKNAATGVVERTDSLRGFPSQQILNFKNFNISYGQNFLFSHKINAVVREGQKILLRGSSGSGKSTLIAALTKTLPSYARIEGCVINCADRIIWVSQEPGASQRTVDDELEFYEVGDIDALIEETGLQSVRMMPVAQLSPGELRRLDVARAVGSLRMLVSGGAKTGVDPGHVSLGRPNPLLPKVLIILDEPTAHLDDGNAQKIRNLIRRQQARYPECTWIISTHDQQLAQLCNEEIFLSAPEASSGEESLPYRATEQGASSASARNNSTETGKNQKPASGLLQIFAILLTVAATASGVCLSALSGWLIVQAGQQLPIFYLMTAIVGVRFFGIARSVLAYWARLTQHKAIFAVITRLRASLWDALARKGLASRAILTPGKALGRMIGDLQTLEQSWPRATAPLLVALTLHVGMIAAVAFAIPAFAPWQILLLAALVLVAAVTWGRMLKLTETSGKLAELLEQTMTYMSRLKIIVVNGQGEKIKLWLRARHREIAETQKKYSYGEGLAAAFITALFLVVTAMAPYILWGWASGRPGKAALMGALMLANMALIGPSVNVFEAIRHSVVVKNVRKRLKIATEVKNYEAGEQERFLDKEETFKGLSLTHADIRWDMDSFVCRGLNFSVDAGNRIIVSGPSGSGKSTLIAVLMGYLPIAGGSYEMVFSGGTAQMHRYHPLSRQWYKARVSFAWCPQQAHIFSSTVRGNLQLASADPFTDKQLYRVLDQVMLQELYRKAEGLDYFVGASGSRLSGGQRTRLALARALLTDAEVIILDEPTAHLDEPTARAVLFDLRLRLGGKTLIMVTHKPEDAAAEDFLFEMAQERLAPPKR